MKTALAPPDESVSRVDLRVLFEPRSIAIVGASAERSKLSGMIVGFLATSGYAGRVYLVNPRYERIDAAPCYPSVEALPETVDILVCVVPVEVAFDVIEAGARSGVPFCLLMSGGFGEGRTGAEGEARRQRLLRICDQNGMHVVGPNTVGMVNFRARLPLTFADWYGRDTGLRGGVAIVTHSGSIGGLVFSSLQLAGIGVDYWFGLGNEATLETADFIAHFNADPNVHTVICYIEGVRDGRSFMRAAAEARRRGKHIVALRAGGHPESVRSTLSHTGKRPSSDDVYAGIFRQLGIVDVVSSAELAYVMMLLTAADSRLGPRVGIISASGGACSLLADHVVDAGLELPELPREMQEMLDRSIPAYGSALNPVDLSADVVSRGEILHGTLAALREDTSVDVWLVFGRPIVDRYYPALIDFARSTSRAVIVSCSVPLEPDVHAALRAGGVPVLEDPELCLRALGRIRRAAATRFPHPLPLSRGERGACFGPLFPLPSGEGSRVRESAKGGDARSVHVAIQDDRDFGAVVALSVAGSSRRVVRALPASAPELRDAVHELTWHDDTLRGSEAHIIESLTRIVEQAATGSTARIEILPAS
jgi:acetate---CoA ligase (ADP-forming)